MEKRTNVSDTINFSDVYGTINFSGDEIFLNTTSSSLCHVPITQAKQLFENFRYTNQYHIILPNTETKLNNETALKLHQSFSTRQSRDLSI